MNIHTHVLLTLRWAPLTINVSRVFFAEKMIFSTTMAKVKIPRNVFINNQWTFSQKVHLNFPIIFKDIRSSSILSSLFPPLIPLLEHCLNSAPSSAAQNHKARNLSFFLYTWHGFRIHASRFTAAAVTCPPRISVCLDWYRNAKSFEIKRVQHPESSSVWNIRQTIYSAIK